MNQSLLVCLKIFFWTWQLRLCTWLCLLKNLQSYFRSSGMVWSLGWKCTHVSVQQALHKNVSPTSVGILSRLPTAVSSVPETLPGTMEVLSNTLHGWSLRWWELKAHIFLRKTNLILMTCVIPQNWKERSNFMLGLCGVSLTWFSILQDSGPSRSFNTSLKGNWQSYKCIWRVCLFKRNWFFKNTFF